MLNEILLYTEENKFFLKISGQSKKQYDLIVKKKKAKQKAVMSCDDLVYSISVKELFELHEKGEEDRLYLYKVSEKREQILVDEECNVKILNNIYLDYEGERCYLYISLDNKIRFVWNKKPSQRSYHIDHTVNEFEIEKEKLKISLHIFTRFLTITKAAIAVRNRKNGMVEYKEEVSARIISSEPGQRLKEVEVSLDYDIRDVINLVSEMNYYNYDNNIFDFYIVPSYEETDVSEKGIRIFYPSESDIEYYLDFSSEYKLLYKFYSTKNLNNLSCRINYLKNDSYDKFMEIMESDPIHLREHNEKPIVLVSEYPQKAQDNGLIFYHYLKKNCADQFNAYYIISEDSEDMENLTPYEDGKVIYKSPEHFELMTRANIIAHAHGSIYALPIVTSFTERYCRAAFRVFLQHGIIGVRNLDYVYGNEDGAFTDMFITSSSREKKIIVDELGYEDDQVVVTGLARFDKLLCGHNPRENYKLRKNILIMPTWRLGLQLMPDEEFVETDYFQILNNLINNATLRNLAKRHGLNISFYLHANFQKFRELFSSDFVDIIPEGKVTVQQLLKDSGLLVTDYSSVGLDFAILGKRVLYYQFDESLKESRESTENFLPGKIITTEKVLISEIKKAIIFNSLPRKYAKKVSHNLYKYMDTNCCERILGEIKKRYKLKEGLE